MDYLQYYAIDWLAMGLTFLGIWQIGNKNRIGFVLMMVANISWIAVGYLSGSLALVLANAMLIVMNLRAIIKWSRDSGA